MLSLKLVKINIILENAYTRAAADLMVPQYYQEICASRWTKSGRYIAAMCSVKLPCSLLCAETTEQKKNEDTCNRGNMKILL